MRHLGRVRRWPATRASVIPPRRGPPRRGVDIRHNRATVCAACYRARGRSMTAATSSEDGVVETVQPPIRVVRRWDFRVVLVVVAFVPFVLALPYLWPRVLDPAVPAPRLERRDDIAATRGAATALRTAYATVARHERNYRTGSTAMAVASGVGAATS